MKHGFLRDFTEADLLAELDRRKLPPVDPPPAFECKRCGTKEYYYGDWNHNRFHTLMEHLKVKHAACPLCVEGGGI